MIILLEAIVARIGIPGGDQTSLEGRVRLLGGLTSRLRQGAGGLSKAY